MSARVYFMKTVNGFKDVSLMSPQDKQWKDGQVYSVCILQFSWFTQYTLKCSQNINKQNVNIADENLTDYSFLSRYHYTKSKNYLKDDIEFVTEFPCLSGHPV